MMLSLTLALLAAAPTPGYASLLAPDAPVRPFSARLLAQAPVPTPAPTVPSDATPSEATDMDTDLRIRDLSLRVADLNERIAGVDTGWPSYALALGVAGGVLSTALLFTVPYLVLSAFASSSANLTLGYVSLGAGIIGVGMLIGATLAAGEAQQLARAERKRLVEERKRLNAELNALRARSEGPKDLSRQPPLPAVRTVPLLAFAF